MKQTFSQFLSESVFESLFTFDDDIEGAQTHHNMWCDSDNFIDTSDSVVIGHFVALEDVPAGFVVFDHTVVEPNPRSNSLDYEPKGCIYLKHNHLAEDDMKKLNRFLKSKNLSILVEPFFP